MNNKANSVPEAMLKKFDEITGLIHDFCSKYLNREFEEYTSRLCAELCRLEPSPLITGRNTSWASGIIHALGRINFLFDPALESPISIKTLCDNFGVSENTILKKSDEIRVIISMDSCPLEWMLPDKCADDPLLWTLSVNGFPMDVRKAPKEIQREAYNLGLIPYIPSKGNESNTDNIIDFKALKKKNTKIVKGNKERAFDFIFKAWGAEDKDERIRFAREALKFYQDCTDAYIILAEDYAGDFTEEKALYEQAVEAGRREIGEENFREYSGNFWRIAETRPYMRARFGLANVLWGMGDKREAIEHLKEMLVLNPNDDQGVRWVLFNWLLDSGEKQDIESLLDEYKDDSFSGMLYNHALFLYKKGDFKEAENKLKEAVASNPYVPSIILGNKKMPKMLPEYMGVGDVNEAVVYLWDAYDLWHNTKGAFNWLKEIYNSSNENPII